MGDMLVNVIKSYGGETWENTHCLRMGGAGGPLSDADMTALGVNTAITAANTASGATVNPLTRILAFERGLLHTAVSIVGVYVTDGLRNDVATPDYFWSTSVSLPGVLAPPASTDALAPGTITLVVGRIPTGFGSRVGRLYLRGLLRMSDIAFNNRGGVDWVNPTQATAYATQVATAVSNSGINNMFVGGANAGAALYSIPHYQSAKTAPSPHLVGQLVGATGVVNLVSGAPRSRQMLKGKKR